MGWLKKKNDPFDAQERALEDQIAAVEAQIRKLASQPPQAPAFASKGVIGVPRLGPGQPRLRSTARPHSSTVPLHPSQPAAGGTDTPPTDSLPDDFSGVKVPLSAPDSVPSRADELGVRKRDWAEYWERFKSNFRPPATSNPKLVNYLAAGGLQGLRPLRYEKRIARNRFLLLALVLAVVLWGIVYLFFIPH